MMLTEKERIFKKQKEMINEPTYVSMGWIKDNSRVEVVNRCCEVDYEEGEKKGFSRPDIEETRKRLKNTGKKVFNGNPYGEWSKFCPMIIAWCKETCEFINADGNSRYTYKYLAITEEGGDIYQEYIPVNFIEVDTLAEVRKIIIMLNTNAKSYSANELFRASCINEEGELSERYNMVMKLKEELDVPNLSLPMIIMFGTDFDNKTKVTSLTPTCYSKEELKRCFLNFYNNMENRTKNEMKILKQSKMYKVLYSHFTKVMNTYQSNEEKRNEVLNLIVNIFVNNFNRCSENDLKRLVSNATQPVLRATLQKWVLKSKSKNENLRNISYYNKEIQRDYII